MPRSHARLPPGRILYVRQRRLLAHGIYLEHVLALAFGLFGLVFGVVGLVAVFRGSRRAAVLSLVAIAASLVVLECGICYYSGGALGFDHLRDVVESPDFRLLFLPGLLIGVVTFLAEMIRRGKSPA